MKQYQTDGLTYYRFEQWQNAPFKHAVFTRKGGVSSGPFDSLNLGGNVGDDPQAVRQNHVKMYNALNVPDERACTVWLVHSADVVIVNNPAQGRRWLAYADAMVTDKPDTPLVMRYADCVPILLADATRGVIAIAHAGWRGTVQGVGVRTMKTMIEAYGCRAQDIQAAIGPSIGPDHYQVGQEVVDAVDAHFGADHQLIRRDPADGTAYLNLWEANRRDLERAGIGQIEVAQICTAENTDEWFSHRKEKGRTGRFGVVISL